MASRSKAGVRRLTATVTRSLGTVSSVALTGGVACLVAAAIVQLIASRLAASALVLSALGLLLLLLAAAMGFNTLRATLVSRRGFYGFNTVVMALLFLAVATVVVVLGTINNLRFDTTAAGEFTLANQTSNVLKDLKQDVEAIAFFAPTDPLQSEMRGRAQDLLEEYRQTTSRFRYRVVDPDVEPEEARRYGINPDTQPATIVITSAGNLQTVNTLLFTSGGGYAANQNLERDFTQAVLAVTRELQKVVYFTTRHGERDPTEVLDGNGFALAKRGLEGDNYIVRQLDLAADRKMPEDVAVLIIAGPRNDLLEEEREPMRQYLLEGGKALFLLDHDAPPTYETLLAEWGVTLGDGMVIDPPHSVSGNPRAPLVPRSRYLDPINLNQFSPITQVLTDSTFFDQAAAVTPVDNQGMHRQPPLPNVFYLSDNLNVIPLIVSSELSWLGTNPDSTAYNPGETIGPLALAVTIDAKAPFQQPLAEEPRRTQLVVIGDSAFASNRFFTSFANGDLFLNSVNWLSGDIQLISVHPKLFTPRLLVVSQGTFNFIRWSSWLLLPLAVAGTGAFIWWRRR